MTYMIIQDFLKDNKCNLLGLTATPGRGNLDEVNELTSLYDNNLIELDLEAVIRLSEGKQIAANSKYDSVISYFKDKGILSRVIGPEILPEKHNYRVRQKEINEYRRSKQVRDSDNVIDILKSRKMNQALVEKLINLVHDGRKIIVFAQSVDHARVLSACLWTKGVINEVVYGDMNYNERRNAIRNFKRKDIRIIINYDVLSTGFDVAKIDCVFITREVSSPMLYSQMIGRGLRGYKMGGTKECLLYDVKENCDKFSNDAIFSCFNDYWN